jgi:hypothetical protein
MTSPDQANFIAVRVVCGSRFSSDGHADEDKFSVPRKNKKPYKKN